MNRISALLLPTVPLLALAMPAAAQDEAGDKVNMVITYGDDPCPQSTETELTICVVKAESERFRIPQNLRDSGSPQLSWSERVERTEMVGDFGTMSCSPAGAGGITGCTQEMINAAYRDRDETSDVRFGQLIEEARADRLSTIDEDAADEQDRVEQIERDYLNRLEAEREAPIGDEEGAEDSSSLPRPPGE